MRGPESCPNCGHDPMGDSDEFVSGGGWSHDNSVADGIYHDQLRCPLCGELVWEETSDMGGFR